MKRIIIQVILTISYVFCYAAEDIKIDFHPGTFEEAKSLAEQEGKLFIVDFYASWCVPCKWMDKSTYSNPDLVNYINEKYIAYRVNIDDIDGYHLKERFDIQYLPTILIYGTAGKLVERIEETMTSLDLISILKSHGELMVPAVVTNQVNHAPGTRTIEPKVDEKRGSNLSPQYEYYLKKNLKTTYKLLVGTYFSKDVATEQYHMLKNRFVQPVMIMNDVDGIDMVYKILLGEFLSEKEAEKYRELLKSDFDIQSTVY